MVSLRNKDFEIEAQSDPNKCHAFPVNKPDYFRVRGEIRRPDGWMPWYKHSEQQPANVPWDENNTNGWAEPEMRLTNPVYKDRRLTGQHGFMGFTFYRIGEHGLYQRVKVEPGTTLKFSAYAHGWIATGEMPPEKSLPGRGALSYNEGDDLTDDQISVLFKVGIDPTGGTDPYADTVVWGEGKHIFNEFDQLEVEATAQNDTITVFTFGSSRWPVMHNDHYWDNCELAVVDGDTPPPSNPNTKLGVHAILSDGTTEMLEHGARVIKMVDDFSMLERINRMYPEAVTIGRCTFDLHVEHGYEYRDPDADLRAIAERGMNAVFEKMGEHLYDFDYVETFVNESDPEDYARLADLMVHCIDIAEERGIKLALLSLNAGTPEWDEMVDMFENSTMFQRAADGGHIISLHEGALPVDQYSEEIQEQYDRYPPVWTWTGAEHVIPGAPKNDTTRNAGAISLRYRYLIHLMHEYDCVSQILISEWYGDYREEQLRKNLEWYDAQVLQDEEVIGFAPFTFGGNMEDWRDRNYTNMLTVFTDYLDSRNAIIPPDDGKKTHDYQVVVELLPQEAELERILDVRRKVYQYRRTICQSFGDAARIADMEQDVINVWDVPENKRDSVIALLAGHYGSKATINFTGRGDDGDDINTLRLICPSDFEPPTITAGGEFGAPRWYGTHEGLDFRGSWRYWKTYVLAPISGKVIKKEYHDSYGNRVVIRNRYGDNVILANIAHLYEPASVEVGEIVERGERIGKAGNTGKSFGAHVHIDLRINGQYVDPSIYMDIDSNKPNITDLGFNDWPEGAGETTAIHWMQSNGLRGVILKPMWLSSPQKYNFTTAANAGIDVIARASWSWSVDEGGAGTLPGPGQTQDFIDNVVYMVKNTPGLAGLVIGNEMNNPREHPRGHTLVPQYIAGVYNAIRQQVDIPMSVGAFDPFNAEMGDPRDMLREVYSLIEGAEFIDTHGYVRGSDPDQVGSEARFADDPMRWQALNYPGCVENLLKALPSGYHDKPIYVTEFNHITRDNGLVGWDHDRSAAEVVSRAYEAAKKLGYRGLCLYRWRGDNWRLYNNEFIREVVKSIARKS